MKNIKLKSIVFILLSTFILFQTNSCKKADPKGNISGEVKDQDGAAIVGAAISINPSAPGAKTSDANGKFSYSDITPLQYTLEASKKDFSKNSITITVTDGQTTSAIITLTKLLEKPTITSQDVGNIGETSATAIGNISNLGSSEVSAHGHCWNTSGAATINDSKVNYGTKTTTGEFTSNLTGLTPNTTYYVRAYATNNAGTVYSDEKSFKTLAENAIPDVTTNAAINIAATTATLGGNVTLAGNSSITERGVCWSTSNNPNISNDHKAASTAAVGEFSVNVTNLTANTTYYLKAYATNTTGTAYGEEKSFTTTSIPAPTSTTQAATAVTSTGSTLNGIINANGNEATVSFEYGVTTSYGSTTNAKPNVVSGSTNTNVSAAISGLSQNTTYHFRVKAVNTGGTTYGDDSSFTTTTIPAPTSTTQAATAITTTGSTLNGIINANGNEATVSFEYGTTTSYGSSTNATPNMVSGSTNTNVNAVISGLSQNTTYHFRVKAVNTGGTTYGDDLSFTTTANSIPILTTNAITNITTTTATSGGNITSDGNASVTARGICWSTSQNPTTADSKTTDGSGTGNFTSNLTSLSANTTYYVRAYAENGVGVAYGNEESFTTETSTTINDYDGNTYNTVQIGEQTWMAENFKGTHDKNGGLLTSYAYDNNESNVATYGRLYTWDEAMKGAPEGWHLPTDEEWKELEMFLGMSQSEADVLGWRGTDEGNKLKESGNINWNSPSAGTNDFNFSALASGIYDSFESKFKNLKESSYFWSSTESSTELAFCRLLDYSVSGINRANNAPKNSSISVRYIKDRPTKAIQDIDGNIYDVVKIGNQYWTKQNLKVTKYSNGMAIPLVTDNTAWNNLTATSKAYSYYDNSSSNKTTYGALYTWAAAMNSASSSTTNPSNIQGVCPTGWHLPSDAEWKDLEMFLGMSQTEADSTAWRGTDEGGKLKETGTTHWNSPNTGATNSSGFTALPGGYRDYDGAFYNIGNGGYWWSSTEYSSSSAWSRLLHNNVSNVHRYDYVKEIGFSVRCVKN